MVGSFQANTWLAFLITTGIILGAAYMLWLYRRVIFGKLTKPDLANILDLNPREILAFVPLILVVLWMGIYPSSFLDVMAPSVERLIGQHKTALQDPDGSWWHRLGRQLALNDPTSGGAR